MKQLIKAHNRKMLDTQDKERRMCDCKKQECPVNGSCLMESIIYKATDITENQTKFYVGSTGLCTSTVSNTKNIKIQQNYCSTFEN